MRIPGPVLTAVTRMRPSGAHHGLIRRCAPAGGFLTRERPDRLRTFETDWRVYQYIGKLNFQLSPNHQLILQYIGTATNLDFLGTLNGATEEQARDP